MEKEKYTIERSKAHPDNWICTDNEHGFVVEWQEHSFNDTQETEIYNPERLHKIADLETKLAKWQRELAEWLCANHYDKIF